MPKILLAILAVSTMGTICLPVRAGENINLQDSRQTTIQTGHGNFSQQRSRQSIREYLENGRGGIANVQTSGQYSDQLGNRNVTNQEQIQETTNIQRSRPR
ncbi:MAG: hypothetical protein GVY17_03260 [Cyanobacteria bacterium]|jgi:hypothetical protein|nr:hypothetical protein [Cyanobacteria bacterium GSL.Bin21]